MKNQDVINQYSNYSHLHIKDEEVIKSEGEIVDQLSEYFTSVEATQDKNGLTNFECLASSLFDFQIEKIKQELDLNLSCIFAKGRSEIIFIFTF